MFGDVFRKQFLKTKLQKTENFENNKKLFSVVLKKKILTLLLIFHHFFFQIILSHYLLQTFKIFFSL